MKRMFLKLGIIWFVYSLIWIWFVYRIQGETVALIPLDIQYAYMGNRKTLLVMLFGLAAVFLFCVYAVMNERKILRLRWDIKIRKGALKLGNLKFFYSNLNRIMYMGVCGAVIILAGSVLVPIVSGNEQRVVDDSWTSYPIAHAMGAIDGYDYTNSLEAFEYNYGLGHRVFEVDFRFTSDNKIICCHGWGSGYQEGIDKEHLPSEKVFKSTPILGKYTPLTLDELLLLMKEYEDIYIVTDTKISDERVLEQFEMIMDAIHDTETEDILDRLIIQIYNGEMLKSIKKVYDFPLIIYTLYQSGWDGTPEGFISLCRFCKNHDIRYVTMWWYLATPEILKIADAYDITVFVHTVNELDKAEELIQNGVKGMYTDELIPALFLEEE